MKRYLHIVIAVILAAGAGVAAWMFININTPSVNVVTTNARMSAGTLIQTNQISTKLVARSVLPADAITDPGLVIGRVLNYGVLGDEILRLEHIAVDKGSLLARLIATAPGMVAVDLSPETAQGLTGLSVGDLVNVYGEIAVNTGGGQVATLIDKVANRSIVLYAPATASRDKTAIIIACKPEEEHRLAQVLSNNKKVTLFLQPGGVEDEDGAIPEDSQITADQ